MPIINENIFYEFGEILVFMSYLHYNNKYTTIWKYKTWKIIWIQIAVYIGLIWSLDAVNMYSISLYDFLVIMINWALFDE